MELPDPTRIYPRSGDTRTVYLKNVVTDPAVTVGDYSFYHDFRSDPRDFQTANLLYHYPGSGDRLSIGRFTSIACGAKFLMTGGNHTLASLSTYPFAIFGEEWDEAMRPREAWDNRGPIVVGSDVWIGFEALVLQGVTIGDGAIVASRAVVTRDVAPYEIVAGVPARRIRSRYPADTVARLLALRWWDWPAETIAANLARIRAGDIDGLEAAAPRP